MRNRLIFGLGLVAMVAAAPAQAADLQRPVYKAPAMVAPLWSWTGFYIGVNAGYGFNSGDVSTTGQTGINIATVADGARPASVSLDRDGFIGGAQIGYNWQSGLWVFGIEADIQYTDFEDSVNVVTTGTAFPGVRNNIFNQELEYLGTVRGRIGYAWDRTLFYGTGGFAYGGVKNNAQFFGPQPANVSQFIGGSDKTETGYTVGGGFEHAFSPNWTFKVEYLYYDLGDTTVAVNFIPGGGGVGTGYNSTFENDGHIVRAGLNYKW